MKSDLPSVHHNFVLLPNFLTSLWWQTDQIGCESAR